MTNLLATLFLIAACAALPFALRDGLDKQAEIDAAKTSDYCRAHPAACDMAGRHD
ncbi:hypothetical protein [Paludisphaera rhizosphaerae]|uniref:hypothetical protein n=1 Tax=Paludisphaera rhizosphaerae TaxID=2711216 RepID=UPI0013EC965C|nr:hypothetical protein [Paludisphaera rhizosphaerae]